MIALCCMFMFESNYNLIKNTVLELNKLSIETTLKVLTICLQLRRGIKEIREIGEIATQKLP